VEDTMPESLQHKLDRVRPPRVQITYDVETGGAIQKKELPFVVGVLADLSGKPAEALPKLKERKFVEIDRDNFNDVLASARPRLAFQVNNVLGGAAEKLNVELSFENMDDFGPLAVIEQVAALRKLYDARQRLSDLLAKLDGNDSLDSVLTEAGRDQDGLKTIKLALTEGGVK
jgi:type VI secretion system protein ImpB